MGKDESMGLIGEVNPILKIFSALALFLVAFTIEEPVRLGLYLTLMTLLLLLLSSAKVSLRPFLVLAPLAVLVGIVNMMGGRADDDVLISMLRVMTVALSITMFAYTTTPSQLIRGLETAKVPGSIVLGATVMMRFIPLMFRDMERVISSSRLRGGGQRRTLRFHYRSLMVPAIAGVYNLADDVTMAMHLRGYDPEAPRSALRSLTPGLMDLIFAISFAIVSLGVLML